MILKWIRCAVADESRDAFSRAQEQWSDLIGVNGFRGQVGGWSERSHGEACILAWWQDDAAYHAFMQNEHNAIVGQSRQETTYDSCEILLLKETLRMPGRYADPVAAVTEAGFLRVADCLLKPDRIQPFTAAQKEIWIKGMEPVDGMLGGSYCEVQNIPRHVLVFSLWSSIETHRTYEVDIMPGLRKRAQVSEDLSYLTGVFVKLESRWSVVAR
jgi:hypothetical protein